MPRYVERRGNAIDMDVSLATLDPRTGILSVRINEARSSERHVLVTDVSSPVPEIRVSAYGLIFFVELISVPIPFSGFDMLIGTDRPLNLEPVPGSWTQQFTYNKDQELTAIGNIYHLLRTDPHPVGGGLPPGVTLGAQIARPGGTNFRVQFTYSQRAFITGDPQFSAPGSIRIRWRPGDDWTEYVLSTIPTSGSPRRYSYSVGRRTGQLYVPNGLRYMGNGILEWNPTGARWYDVQVASEPTGSPPIRTWETYVTARPQQINEIDPTRTGGQTRDATPAGQSRAYLPRHTEGTAVRVRGVSSTPRGSLLTAAALTDWSDVFNLPAAPDIPAVDPTQPDPAEFQHTIAATRTAVTAVNLLAKQYIEQRGLPPGADRIQFAYRIYAVSRYDVAGRDLVVQPQHFDYAYPPRKRHPNDPANVRRGVFKLLPDMPVANFVRSGGTDKTYPIATFNPQVLTMDSQNLNPGGTYNTIGMQHVLIADWALMERAGPIANPATASLVVNLYLVGRVRSGNAWSEWGWGSASASSALLTYPTAARRSDPGDTHLPLVDPTDPTILFASGVQTGSLELRSTRSTRGPRNTRVESITWPIPITS